MRTQVLGTVLTLFLSSVAFAHDTRTLRYRLVKVEDANAAVTPAIPRALNNRGSITGEGFSSQGRTAFLWRNGRLIELASDGTLAPTEGLGMNDRGQVVGIGVLAGPPGVNRIRGFIWNRGRITPIGDLPGGIEWSVAYDINERRQVVGASESDIGREAVLWQDGDLMSLGDLPGNGTFAHAFAINEWGIAVGQGSTDVGHTGHHAFIWRNGRMSPLPVPTEAFASAANDVNNFNVVVGYIGLGDIIVQHLEATAWHRGRAITLPPLDPEFNSSVANAINDLGDIVGTSTATATGLSAATLWRRGVAYNLTELIADDDPLKSCVVLFFATAINERGEIAALGGNSCENGNSVTLRMEPLRDKKRHPLRH
jgi:probable HAF family extracellular repeat protein